MKNLFQKKLVFPFALVLFLFVQLIYSFLFPSVGFDDNWLPVDTYLPKFEIESSDSFLLEKIYPLISKNYRLNSDVGDYLEVGKSFTPEYFENHVLLSRPLYPFFVYLASLSLRPFIDLSYGIIFGIAILINFALVTFAALLFFVLLKRIFSLRVAFLSSLLLIFSPLVHSALIQPRAESFTVFAVVAAGYLLYEYTKAPSTFKLFVFSFGIGILMLAKMFFALPLFIVFLAIFFRRYKEGLIFCVNCVIPYGLWYLFVTQIWQIPFYVHETQYYQGGMWFLHLFEWPWYQIYKVFLGSFPNFVESITFSFLFFPIFFSLLGLEKWHFSARHIFYFGAMSSVFLFSLLVNIYYYRITFLLFPIIYPTCILGIERVALSLRKYHPLLYQFSFIFFVGIIIVSSSMNVFRLVPYL